jgi:hypothetical protein
MKLYGKKAWHRVVAWMDYELLIWHRNGIKFLGASKNDPSCFSVDPYKLGDFFIH